MSGSNTIGTIDGSILYHYTPSLSLAASFCALFGVSTALHTYQTILTKSWYMVPMILGGVFETVGYVGRALGASEAPNYSLGPYIVQAILILVGPTLIAASIYMMMGHIIRATDGDRCSIIRERVLTKVFVIGDLMSFTIQSMGASMLTKKDQKQKVAGNYIIIGGLVLQLLFFGLFMVTTVMFWTRLARDESKSRTPTLIPTGVSWKSHVLVLFMCSISIMMRSTFRVVEYAQGQNGYCLSHESFLYIFDATLMFLALATLNVAHPSKVSVLNKEGGGIAISWMISGESVDAKAAGAAKAGTEMDEEAVYKLVGHEIQASYCVQRQTM